MSILDAYIPTVSIVDAYRHYIGTLLTWYYTETRKKSKSVRIYSLSLFLFGNALLNFLNLNGTIEQYVRGEEL